MRFELFIAARYLRAKRRQAVVGVVTVISIVGVAAGVAALIIALAITNGMSSDLQGRLVDSSAHIQLMATDGFGIDDWRNVLAKVRAVPHVVAAAPGLYEQVFISRGARGGGALVEGILPDQEKTITRLLNSATPGSLNLLEPQAEPQAGGSGATPPVILGKDLADTVGATIGDTVTLISPQGELTPVGVIPKYVPFRLVGTYHTGFYQYDSEMGFIRLGDAQQLFDEPDLISVISIRVDDPDRAPAATRNRRTRCRF